MKHKGKLSNSALECYIDGGRIATYSIQSTGDVHTDDIIKFAKQDSAIGLTDKTQFSISSRHNDGSYYIMVVEPLLDKPIRCWDGKKLFDRWW